MKFKKFRSIHKYAPTEQYFLTKHLTHISLMRKLMTDTQYKEARIQNSKTNQCDIYVSPRMRTQRLAQTQIHSNTQLLFGTAGPKITTVYNKHTRVHVRCARPH